MVEYLLVATLVIGAILLIQPDLKNAIDTLFRNAKDKAFEAANRLGSITLP